MPTRGGSATFWIEIAFSSNFGLDISQRDLPIDSQVASACDLLGFDPLYVANEGLFLSFVDASIADQFLETLHKDYRFLLTEVH